MTAAQNFLASIWPLIEILRSLVLVTVLLPVIMFIIESQVYVTSCGTRYSATVMHMCDGTDRTGGEVNRTWRERTVKYHGRGLHAMHRLSVSSRPPLSIFTRRNCAQYVPCTVGIAPEAEGVGGAADDDARIDNYPTITHRQPKYRDVGERRSFTASCYCSYL